MRQEAGDSPGNRPRQPNWNRGAAITGNAAVQGAMRHVGVTSVSATPIDEQSGPSRGSPRPAHLGSLPLDGGIQRGLISLKPAGCSPLVPVSVLSQARNR